MHTVHIPGEVEKEITFAIPARPAQETAKAEMPAVVVTGQYLTVSDAELPALHAETLAIVAASLNVELPSVIEAVKAYIPSSIMVRAGYTAEMHIQALASAGEAVRRSGQAHEGREFVAPAPEPKPLSIISTRLTAPQAAAVEEFFRGVKSPALHAQTVQAIQEELDKPLPEPPKKRKLSTRLRMAVSALVAAEEADSWKGGGDPDDHESIERTLERAQARFAGLLLEVDALEGRS